VESLQPGDDENLWKRLMRKEFWSLLYLWDCVLRKRRHGGKLTED
jgi:hypothetical protein